MNRLGISRRDIFVGDHRATIPEFQFGAIPPEVAEQAGANLDFVTASAERHINNTHAVRIKAVPYVSIVSISTWKFVVPPLGGRKAS